MLRKSLLLLMIGVITYSCNSVDKQSTGAPETVTISELVSEPLNFENKMVTFNGTITHICRHSGDKIRINQMDDSSFSIMVMLEEFQSQFSSESEGRQIEITGVLKTHIRNPEQAATNQTHASQREHSHTCAASEDAQKKLQEKGIARDIIAFIELTGFEIIETDGVEDDNVDEDPTKVVEVI